MQAYMLFLFLTFFLPLQAWAYDVREALEVAKDHKNTIGTSAGINAHIVGPATSDTVSFSTYDGEQTFTANITCPNQSPAVIVSASSAAGGELNLHVQYDANLDGTLEGQIYLKNVAGACADGLIRECSPSGSWQRCNYCQWVFKDGEIQNVCTTSTTNVNGTNANGTSASAIAPESLSGCFCFNDSCGAPTVDLLETILSFTAKGVMDLLQKQNNLLVLTQVDYEDGDDSLTYLGSKVSDCDTGSLSSGELSQLTGLYGQVVFPTGDAIDEALDDPSSAYSTVASTFDDTATSLISCNKYAQVGVEMRTFSENYRLKFGIGLDDHGYGNSSQCYWGGTGGYDDCEMGLVLEECGNWNTCVGAIVPDKLQSICHYFLVNTGYFTSITSAGNAAPVSAMYDIYGCYGGHNTATDQYWETDCLGVRNDNAFICRSPSMYTGTTIVNEPYNPDLYSGCAEVTAPLSSCDRLEAKAETGECTIETEIVDGVYTIKNGVRTGLEASEECRVFETGTSNNRAIAVCEPWWEINRVYRCESETTPTYNFDAIKERTEYIGKTTEYNEKTGLWSSTSDLGWNEDGEETSQVYDVDIEFDTEYDICIPACKVERKGSNTSIYVPAATVNEDSSGSYTGESTWTYDTDTIITEMKECVQDNNAEWSCPVDAGETKVQGCVCYDEESFVDSIFQLQIINQASSDVICSSGTVQGTCVDDEDESIRVVCGDFDFNDGGVIDISTEDIYDCSPKLWKGPAIANQTHTLSMNEKLQCVASVGNASLAQIVNDEIATIVPSVVWFSDMVDWAKNAIMTTLKEDTHFIPLPEDACVCDTTCDWKLGSSVNDMIVEEHLSTNSENYFPFGYIDVKIHVKGMWSGADGEVCNAKSETYTFRVGVVINENLFEQHLYLLKNSKLTRIDSADFTNTSVFINACLSKYTDAYLNFTDESIGGDFVFSFADELIYQVAAKNDELPHTTSSDAYGSYTLLPYPAVYRAAMPTSADSASSVVSNVPNSPMFFEKKMMPTHHDEGLFGEYSLLFTSLYPYVYYWECPEGTQVKGSVNVCGADVDSGTGGVFETIDGNWCVQYACDAAVVTNSDAINEGCGYADDGSWK